MDINKFIEGIIETPPTSANHYRGGKKACGERLLDESNIVIGDLVSDPNHSGVSFQDPDFQYYYTDLMSPFSRNEDDFDYVGTCIINFLLQQSYVSRIDWTHDDTFLRFGRPSINTFLSETADVHFTSCYLIGQQIKKNLELPPTNGFSQRFVLKDSLSQLLEKEQTLRISTVCFSHIPSFQFILNTLKLLTPFFQDCVSIAVKGTTNELDDIEALMDRRFPIKFTEKRTSTYRKKNTGILIFQFTT